jgi:hypothetical protein
MQYPDYLLIGPTQVDFGIRASHFPMLVDFGRIGLIIWVVFGFRVIYG